MSLSNRLCSSSHLGVFDFEISLKDLEHDMIFFYMKGGQMNFPISESSTPLAFEPMILEPPAPPPEWKQCLDLEVFFLLCFLDYLLCFYFIHGFFRCCGCGGDEMAQISFQA